MTEEITVEAAGGGDQPPAEIQEKIQLVKEQITAKPRTRHSAQQRGPEKIELSQVQWVYWLDEQELTELVYQTMNFWTYQTYPCRATIVSEKSSSYF